MTQTQRIVAALKEGKKTSAYFVDVMRVFKYSSRIAELRQKGYVIEANRIKGSLFEYELVRDPFAGATAPVQPPVNKSVDERPKFGMGYCAEHKRNYALYGNCVDCL